MESLVNKLFVKFFLKKSENTVSALSSKILFENGSDIKPVFDAKNKFRETLCVILCALIYNKNAFYTTIDYWGLDQSKFIIYDIDDGEFVYCSYYSDNNLFISFKGSSEISDWITNIQMKTCREKSIKGKVHHGFYGMATKNDRDTALINLIESYPKDTYVYLTGHSLGAAVSSVMYSLLKEKFLSRMSLITFGSPRVGNKEFSKSILNHSRFVNGNDAVAKLPLPIRYWHSNILIQFHQSNWFNFNTKDHDIHQYYINCRRFNKI